MIGLIIKTLLRKKWNMFKIFIIGPINRVLPMLLLSSTILNDVDDQIVFKLCLYSCFTFTIFEIVYARMEYLSNEKIQDIIISDTSILKYNLYHTIATNLFYIPSYLITLFLYSLILNINISIGLIIFSTIILIINNIIFSNITLSIHLKTSNYFNTFNLFMDGVYILAGVVYPITVFPVFIQAISKVIPITYALNFNFESLEDIKYLIIVFIITYLLSYFSIKSSKSKYINNGGFYD